MVPAHHHKPVWLIAAAAAAASSAAAGATVAYRVIDSGVPVPLTHELGDPGRGRAAALDPERGNCSICHVLPGVPGGGDVGPSLESVGTRLAVPQLRLRVIDSRRLNPASTMPPYYKMGVARVARKWRGRTTFSEQEVEDVVAYLASLR